jgi:hypothetical protein
MELVVFLRVWWFVEGVRKSKKSFGGGEGGGGGRKLKREVLERNMKRGR